METLLILPSPHRFIDYDDFAFASENTHHNFTFQHKIDDDDENEKTKEDFNFACTNLQESLVTADEIFHNGKIRPLFPIFDQAHDEPRLSRDLSLKTMVLDLVVDDSKKMNKSNSTGFSKLLRFRKDQQLRSSSNGKDTFVFLNPPTIAKKSQKAMRNDDVVKNGKCKMTQSSSAHEKLYMMNRKRKESNKRKSFLPYKQQLFGFFINMNGFSKNVHPF